MRKSLKQKIAGKKWEKMLNRWAKKAAERMRDEIDREILSKILEEHKDARGWQADC